MSHDKESFVTYNKWEKGQLMFLKDNTTHQIIGQGDVSIKLNNAQIKEMGNVLHVLSLWKKLFSTMQLDQARGEIIIKYGKHVLKNSQGIKISQCILEADLYKLRSLKKRNENDLPVIVNMNKANIWHMKLSHINQRRLKEIQFMSKGVESFDEKSLIQCPLCVKGNNIKLSL